MMNNENGFTLIELMVVVVIIGILAAIAVPNFSTYSDKGKTVEAMAFADEARKNVIDYLSFKGELPADNEKAGMAPPDSIKGNFVDSVTINNGIISVAFRDDLGGSLAGKAYVLTPEIPPGNPMAPITWSSEIIHPEAL